MIKFVPFKTDSTYHATELDSRHYYNTALSHWSVVDLKDELEDIANDCAEEYWYYHDGDEAEWPITFSIFKDDELIGHVYVDYEMSPSFSSSEIV